MRITFGHALVAITAITAALIPISTSPANAAPADKPKPPAATTHHENPGHENPNVVPIPHANPHSRTTTLTTQIPRASIRTLASTDRRSRTVTTLRGKGSTVEVSCYLLGERVSGDRTWYRTVSPSTGYISGAELAIRHEPAMHVQQCTMNSVKR